MRRVTDYPLWLGHIGDAHNLPMLISAGISAVVDLAGDESPVVLSRELIYLRFPLIDGGGNPHWLLRVSVDTVAGLLRAGVPTLIYCGACMSRSPSVAGAAIASVRGCSLAEGLALAVCSGSADVSPALWSDIEAATA